jgi:hypothetical protein
LTDDIFNPTDDIFNLTGGIRDLAEDILNPGVGEVLNSNRVQNPVRVGNED